MTRSNQNAFSAPDVTKVEHAKAGKTNCYIDKDVATAIARGLRRHEIRFAHARN